MKHLDGKTIRINDQVSVRASYWAKGHHERVYFNEGSRARAVWDCKANAWMKTPKFGWDSEWLSKLESAIAEHDTQPTTESRQTGVHTCLIPSHETLNRVRSRFEDGFSPDLSLAATRLIYDQALEEERRLQLKPCQLVFWSDDDCPRGDIKGRLDLRIDGEVVASRFVKSASENRRLHQELEDIAYDRGYEVVCFYVGNPRRAEGA